MASLKYEEYPYPRRRVIRWILRVLANIAIFLLIKVKIEGKENIPSKGPFIIIGNHFSFIDPVMVIAKIPFWTEFVGGTVNPGAPDIVRGIPKLWGILNVYRGTSSREALIAAQTILDQDGVLGIFPEGGNWANVLRPPRPGTAFLAQRMGVPIMPIGFTGLEYVFQRIKLFKRAPITMRIGKPFGPLGVEIEGRPTREQYDEMGHELMRQIASLIAPEQRGFYSDDPAIREAAKGTEVWPWSDKLEGEVPKFHNRAT